METKMQIDRIRGSLVGGAIGDALGYPVEFIPSFKEIQAKYGEKGITRWMFSSGGERERNHRVRRGYRTTRR